jgi:hypothetical protein
MIAARKIARKTTKKAGKKKRQPAPGTTAVKDRVVGVTLGHEAQTLAGFLRVYGADPGLVPDMSDDAARFDFMAGRARYVKDIPMWALDLVAAILKQIPLRSPRKAGRPKTDAVRNVERWAYGMPVADAARLVATMEIRQREGGGSENEIEKRAEQLAHLVYRRRRKPDVT